VHGQRIPLNKKKTNCRLIDNIITTNHDDDSDGDNNMHNKTGQANLLWKTLSTAICSAGVMIEVLRAVTGRVWGKGLPIPFANYMVWTL